MLTGIVTMDAEGGITFTATATGLVYFVEPASVHTADDLKARARRGEAITVTRAQLAVDVTEPVGDYPAGYLDIAEFQPGELHLADGYWVRADGTRITEEGH